MAVRAITDNYRFPSRSRQELYGDDQLVDVMWQGNPMFCSAACFRAPKAMTWSEFLAGVVDPWASNDPDYTAGAGHDWTVDDQPIAPAPQASLAELGVGHKSLITFRT
ncbi:MAG: phenol hydroxylase subunit P4 [Sciscionella sp.]